MGQGGFGALQALPSNAGRLRCGKFRAYIGSSGGPLSRRHGDTPVMRKCASVAVAAIMGMFAMSANASDAVLLHAAGSLRGALLDVGQAFEKSSGLKVQAKFGPSGLLRDEIAAGGKAEVFASANMEHPLALAKAGKSGPAVLFARNKLCALVRPGAHRDKRKFTGAHARP
jgi:ABC-type molybdate transport system substrate-binding protein